MSEANYQCNDVVSFYNSSTRNTNDSINKKREDMICDLINNKVNEGYLKDNTYGRKWRSIKKNIIKFFEDIYGEFKKIKCTKKAGRNYNHDFDIDITKLDNTVNKYKFEFKYGSTSIELQPQFVSLGNISNYFDIDFIQYYYNNHLEKVCKLYEKEKPSFDEYKKDVCSTTPKCLEVIQRLYYNGCPKSSKYNVTGIYKSKTIKCKEISKEAIKDYLNNSKIRIDVLNKKLHDTQNEKCYMLCKDGEFYFQQLDKKSYTIKTGIKPKVVNDNSLDLITENNSIIRVLLRWKNGNGIAFPALQIKNII